MGGSPVARRSYKPFGHLRSRTQPVCDCLCPHAPESACHPWRRQAAPSRQARRLQAGLPAPCNDVDAAVCWGCGLHGVRVRVSSVHQAADRRLPGSRGLLSGEGILTARGIDSGTGRKRTPQGTRESRSTWPASPGTKCHPRDPSMRHLRRKPSLRQAPVRPRGIGLVVFVAVSCAEAYVALGRRTCPEVLRVASAPGRLDRAWVARCACASVGRVPTPER